MATRIGVMYLGRIVELAPTEELFERPRHPYTRMLLDALPDLAMTGRPRRPIEGEIPNPIVPPPGCAFHPRCPHAYEPCPSTCRLSWSAAATPPPAMRWRPGGFEQNVPEPDQHLRREFCASALGALLSDAHPLHGDF